mmetsp:Transcript_48751/g.109468  ORF Transcript_48751/g.109468 Transcript_48751/m.109468 type:complete len:281 (+) Transcript_48751:30-872(+)
MVEEFGVPKLPQGRARPQSAPGAKHRVLLLPQSNEHQQNANADHHARSPASSPRQKRLGVANAADGPPQLWRDTLVAASLKLDFTSAGCRDGTGCPWRRLARELSRSAAGLRTDLEALVKQSSPAPIDARPLPAFPLAHEHESLQAVKSSYDALLKTHAIAQHDVIAARAEATETRASLKALQAEHTQLGVQHVATVEEVSVLQKDNHRLRESLLSAQQTAEELERREREALQAVEDLRQDMLKANDSAGLARAEIDRLKACLAAVPKRKPKPRKRSRKR